MSENKRKSANKNRNRRQNFDERDIETLVDILCQYKDHQEVFATKDLDSRAWEAKNAAWNRIMDEYNSKSTISRPVSSLREKFQNLRKKLRTILSTPDSAWITEDNELKFKNKYQTYFRKFAGFYYEIHSDKVRNWMTEVSNDSEFEQDNNEAEPHEGTVHFDSNEFVRNLESINKSNEEKSFLDFLDSSDDEVKHKIHEGKKRVKAENIEELLNRTHDLSLEELERRVILQKERLVQLKIIEQKRKMRRNRELHSARLYALRSGNHSQNNENYKDTL